MEQPGSLNFSFCAILPGAYAIRHGQMVGTVFLGRGHGNMPRATPDKLRIRYVITGQGDPSNLELKVGQCTSMHYVWS